VKSERYAENMTRYAILKALNDPNDYVHARKIGTTINRTECGLETPSMPVEGPVSCPTCKRAINE
jgi:hypothetical protein